MPHSGLAESVRYIDGWTQWRDKAPPERKSDPFLAFMDAVHGTHPRDITVEAAVMRMVRLPSGYSAT